MRSVDLPKLRLLLMAAAVLAACWLPAAPSCAQLLHGGFSLAPNDRLLIHTVSPEPQPLHWYGASIVVVEAMGVGVSAAALVVSAATDSREPFSTVALACAGVLVLGTPIFHWVHGQVTRGLISFGVRLLSAFVFLVGTLSVVYSDHQEGVVETGMSMMALGMGGIIATGLVDARSALENLDPAPRAHTAVRAKGLGFSLSW